MIEITTSKGDFKKTIKRLEALQNGSVFSDLEKYGQMGLDALRRATPVETGISAESWYYVVKNRRRWPSISWHNDNVVSGVPVVILLQYGHGTRSGTYVQGRDFINPAIQPVFDKIAEDVWKKVKAL